MIKRKSLSAALLLTLVFPALALAQSTSWATTQGGKLRLVALPPSPDGIISGFIEIVPDDGWHTYWKVPGSGGIPPQVSIKPGGNADLVRMDFPPPQVFKSGNLRDFGYDSGVRLPVVFRQPALHATSTIDANVFVGLCSDICVPFQTDLKLTFNDGDKATAGETALVHAASAALPEGESADFKIGQVRSADDGHAVLLSLTLPAGADASALKLIVTGVDGQALGEPSPVSTDGPVATFSIPPLASNGSSSPKGQRIDILAEAAGRAMETSIVVP